MKYSTPGVSRQRSHKSNSTYIIKLWTSPLNHSTDKSHNTILNEASVGRRIIFSISHKWRRMSTYSILVIYDNLFWWKIILNPILMKMHHHICYSSSFQTHFGNLISGGRFDHLITVVIGLPSCERVKLILFQYFLPWSLSFIDTESFEHRMKYPWILITKYI